MYLSVYGYKSNCGSDCYMFHQSRFPASKFLFTSTLRLIEKDTRFNNGLQHVVEEMTVCVKQAREYEMEIFSKHIARCSVFYASSMVCIYLTATAFSIGPAALPLSFPSEAEYPFSVNYTPVYVIIYTQQSILSYQCAAHICLSMFGSLLLWFTAARFQCLAMELKKTSDVSTLIVCVEKQLYLRRYAKEVVDNLRYIVLYAIGVSTSALTLCGIILLVDVPPMVKIQFVTLCLTLLTEIYVYAWSADYMKDMVNQVLLFKCKERGSNMTTFIDETLIIFMKRFDIQKDI
ncbi:uncharacterized protein LOC117237817 [Bombus vosnesenskii]|uniref:Uncharacterized protein LOC117237817 n=1 Tax=Bombus vosnesenskii TaxID=207650 RepID=A0A6J3KXE7_9HYME|nr:uncharacterized protein LOC117237817 [Bombus vosnesenskii]